MDISIRLDVPYDPRCVSCGGKQSDHIEEEDNSYCLCKLDSTQLPSFTHGPSCPCRKFIGTSDAPQWRSPRERRELGLP